MTVFGLQYFGFVELWSPIFLCFMLLVVIAYFVVTGPWRERFAGSSPLEPRHKFYFLTGAFLLYLVQGGPLELMSHLTFSAHMIAMAVSYMMAPPLIILGIPAWLWRAAFQWKGFRKLSFLMHPIMTVLMFNILFSIYHMPNIHDQIMTNYALHTVYYIILLITAFMMWWNVICPVPEWNRLTDLRKMGYIFLSGMLLNPACALIIFAGKPLFETYNNPEVWAVAMGYCVPGDPSVLLEMFEGPQFFTPFTPAEDQQLGGIVMKLLQEFIYGAVLARVFFHWFRKEKENDDRTPDELLGREGQWNRA
jgi:putative membrane protein